ncbi:MAG: hypothetical protein ACFFA0_09335, partial [Promethearchaeota archaeon]
KKLKLIYMKRTKKITILLLCSTLFLFPFISSAKGETTVGDTTFGVDIGENYIWTYTTDISDTFIGDKFNVTVSDIYPVYLGCMVHIMMDYYDADYGTWYPVEDDDWVVANETQDMIDFNPNSYSFIATWLLFFIPTPINLTMLGEWAVNDVGICDSYTVSGSSVFLEIIAYSGGHRLTYNSDGVMTKDTYIILGETGIVLSLGGGGGGNIPFGYYFLIFTVIGALALIYLEKKKIK